MKIKVTSRITRRERITTGVLCGTYTTVWLAAGSYLPGADLSVTTTGAGLIVPAGWALIFWMCKTTIDFIDERKAAEEKQDPQARLGEVLVNAAQRERDATPPPPPAPIRTYVRDGVLYGAPAGRVIDGEVLSR